MNETPDDASIHERMERAYKEQFGFRGQFRRPPERQVKAGARITLQGREQWKNRFRISAKLTAETYPALIKFCQERDLSVNSALRQILTDYFNLAS